MAWPLCVHGGIEVGYLVDNLRFAVIFISQTNIKGVSMRHRNLDFFYLRPILVQKKDLKRLRYASAVNTTFK